MINLLKGEFYKLFKSRAFYICAMVAVVSVIFMYGMLITADGIERGNIENGFGGVHVSDDSGLDSTEFLLEQMTSLEVLQQLYGSFGGFITVVFVSIFVVGEYTNGAVKNVVGKGYTRGKIFAAKYISTSAATVLLLLVMTVVSTLCGSVILTDQTFDSAFLKDMFQFVGIQFLLGTGLSGVGILIAELCRTLGAGITISIGIVTFSTMVTGALDLLVRLAMPDTKFSFADYWLLDLMEKCPLKDIGTDFAVRAVFVGIVWLVFTAGLGALHFKKADIK